jgi:CRP-like cAMP-binding protein
MPQRDFFAFCTSLRLVELKAIGALSQVKHFAEGELVYSAGDRGNELFIINRGGVERRSQSARPGAAATVLSRGDIFGETGALMDLPRDHTVRACATLSVQCFRRCDFPELLRRVPSFFLFLSEKLASRLFQAKELARSQNNSLELTGSLANFDIVTIYQTIIQSMKTGLLTIAGEKGETISTFYFEKGVPRWGRFAHLRGEEAFWQLFLHEHLAGTFSFSNDARARAEWGEESAMRRHPDEILINAIRMRDEFEDLRRRIPDRTATMKRQQLNLAWDNPELEDLRPVAEEIWQLVYSQPMSLADLLQRSAFCDLKVYQTADEMVRSGLFSIHAPREDRILLRH